MKSEMNRRTLTKVISLTLLILLLACASGEPAVDQNDILTINASPATITNFGDSSTITLTLTHPDGRPVPDGARILLTTDGGSIEPEVRTVDGRAQLPFFSDASTGAVTITAQSGQLGLETPISTSVEVIDRTVAVEGINLGVNPSNVTHIGGKVLLNATVFDPNGDPIPDKVVVFSSVYGSLASNGALLRTDSQGRASDLLTLERLPANLESVEVTVEVSGKTASKAISVTTNESPTAKIAFSPENPKQGDTVFFNGSQSTDPDGQIVKYEWDFGQGEGAVGREAQFTFTTARNHVVTLTVTDDQGASHATTEIIAVGANEPPTPMFSTSPTNPRTGDLITFDASASTDSDGNIVSYLWTLGNGITRTGQVITFSYPDARDYNVTLTVTDNNGSSAALTEMITILGNQAPTAEITASSQTVRVGQAIELDAGGSTDEDGFIDGFFWEFGDGRDSREQRTSVAYGQAGTYLISLTVVDNEEARGFDSITVTVSDNFPPTAAFTVTPSQPKAGQTVTFDASGSSDSDGSILYYRWSFGDNGSGVGRQVQHRYETAFEYLVTLEIEDNLGGKAIASQEVTVIATTAPIANLSASAQTVSPQGESILLDASASSDPDGTGNLTYAFRVSPGGAATFFHSAASSPLAVASIQPLPDGTQLFFEVEVTDEDGLESRDIVQVNVSETASQNGPNAQFTISPTQLNIAGGQVILDASATTDADTAFEDLEFTYTTEIAGNVNVSIPAGDGFLRTAQITGPGGGPISPNDQVVFVLLVTDSSGLKGRQTKTLTFVEGASNTAPVASLTTDPAISFSAPGPGSSVTVLLDARASFDNEDGEPIRYNFKAFHSGGQNIIVTPSDTDPRLAVADIHSVAPGSFVIFTLEVTDSGDLTDVVSVTLSVL